ncbi:MAG: UDP-forming cellulose synthase catalytic subunit [Deltaproteobacteria bacterium]|nr:UDP-forming cellulose synthase catalytic subunit [Deltaproteobacteria bacterium]
MNSPTRSQGDLKNKAARGILVLSILVSIIYLAYAENYLSLTVQFLIGWSFLGIVIILHRINVFRQVPLRLVFLVFSALISFRYLLWRTFETLIYTGPFDLIGMTLLYLAEAYALTIHFLGIYVNAWPIKHQSAPLPDNPDKFPTVDILIPTYNESEEIIRITLTAATQQEYPKDKFKIYLLDDGSTVAKRNNPATSAAAWERHYRFKRMAEELGVNYITRERNIHAKAGNINHALKYTHGELAAVLDCDHVPTRVFLKETVGWFLKDEKLFLVQTPHFFINPTPVEKNLSDFSNVPGENDMFYKVIHQGLDFWNSSYFCGSAAVLRRSCLEEVGGISGQTITEDAETSFVLHGRGYNSVYIGTPMTCGLSPDTFDDYIVQRTRWAKGMIQLFMLDNPLISKGLTFSQRLCYFNSCFFWLFGLSRIVFYLAPAAFLILGLKVYNASIYQVLVYGVPHVISTFIVMDFLYGRARQPFFSEIYESVQSIFLVPAILSVILNPRKPTFEITPKGNRLEANYLSRHASTFFMLAVVNIVTIPLAVVKWINFPLFRDVILITFCWAVFNILLALISLGAFWEKKQVRSYHRAKADGPVEAYSPRLDMTIRGEIKDISLTGMGIEIAGSSPLKEGEDLTLEVFDSYGDRYNFPAKVQRHIRKGSKVFCGVEFVMDKEIYSRLVKFVYGDTRRWSGIWEARSKSTGTLDELLAFFRMGVKASMDCFIYLNKSAFFGIKRYVVSALGKAQTLYEKI